MSTIEVDSDGMFEPAKLDMKAINGDIKDAENQLEGLMTHFGSGANTATTSSMLNVNVEAGSKEAEIIDKVGASYEAAGQKAASFKI
jgi:hypothetical protein